MQIPADLYGIVLHVYFCLITLILSWWIGIEMGSPFSAFFLLWMGLRIILNS